MSLYDDRGYWDRIERLKAACELLQKLPIPDETTQRVNLMRLDHVELDLRNILRESSYNVVLWTGSRDTKPAAHIQCEDWDYALGNHPE